MDVAVEQASRIVVSTANPWVFSEDVAVGDARYLMRWSINEHYFAEVAVSEMGPDQTIEGVTSGQDPDFSAMVKWDGCTDWRLGDHHTCDPEHVKALCGAMVYVQTRGLQVLEARQELAALSGNG